MKQTIAVIFGGQSSEHEVSCMSVVNVASQIDREKYEVLLIGITEEGHWVKADSVESIQDGSWRESRVSAVISPDATEKCVIPEEDGRTEKRPIDVAFPVLHGLYGEDGTIQGLLELARIPYVGCGVLASAVSMDKLYTKIVVDDLGIRQAQYVAVRREELDDMEAVILRVEEKLSYPVFVKPSNAGSSKGVSKAEDRDGLKKALTEAARHDRKILVEETIVGHEVECAVFGGGRTEAALACEKRKIVKIVLCSHKCILDLHDGSEGQGAELFRLSGEAQIELALFKHLQRVVGGLTGNSDPEVRMKLDEILQRGQKDVFAEGRADPDAQLAHTELVAQAQLVFRAFERLQGGSDMGEKKLTVFCQPHSPGGADKQGRAHRLFQLLYGFADSGLADKELVGGAGDVSGPGYRVKDTV